MQSYIAIFDLSSVLALIYVKPRDSFLLLYYNFDYQVFTWINICYKIVTYGAFMQKIREDVTNQGAALIVG